MWRILFILLLLPFASATTTYTEFTEHTIEGNKHTLISGVSNLQDSQGTWKPFSDIAKIQYTDYKIRFSFRKYWVEYSPYVIFNGEKYSLEWIINNFNGVRQHIDVNKNRDNHKWALTISGIPTHLKEGTEFLGFDFYDANNLNWSDIRIDRNKYAIIIKDTVALSYFDLIWHEYCLDINKQTFRIGCLNHDYNYYGEIINHWVQDENGLWSITFDPTFQKAVSVSSDDAENTNFPIYDDDDEFYYLANKLTEGFTWGTRFQDVTVPKNTTIDSAELEFATWVTLAGTAPIVKAICYGVDEDDLLTWGESLSEMFNVPCDDGDLDSWGGNTSRWTDYYNDFRKTIIGWFDIYKEYPTQENVDDFNVSFKARVEDDLTTNDNMRVKFMSAGTSRDAVEGSEGYALDIHVTSGSESVLLRKHTDSTESTVLDCGFEAQSATEYEYKIERKSGVWKVWIDGDYKGSASDNTYNTFNYFVLSADAWNDQPPVGNTHIDDILVSEIISNEPKDATKTTAEDHFQITGGGDTPNGAYVMRDFNATEMVQEIINRDGWSSGNAMAFVGKDNGSTFEGRIGTANMKFWTFDNLSGIPVEKLTISWTTPTAEIDRGNVFFVNNFKVISSFFRNIYLLLQPIFNNIEVFMP